MSKHLCFPFPRSIDRGPIEAKLGTEADVLAVDFPRSIDRGPIEASRPHTRRCTCRPFRDPLIAAPLKLARRRILPWPNPTFPRSIDRGPIEARSWSEDRQA